MNENYEKLDKFFKIDLKIKDLILKTKPNEKIYDTSGAIKYVDNLIKELDTIKDYFFWIIDTYNMTPYLKDVINNSFNEYNEKLLNSNYDYDKLTRIYQECILKMTVGLEKELQKNLFGYNINRKEVKSFEKCKTINDYLHAFHFYIVNNEKIFHSMPIIDRKINKDDEPIILFGKENDLSRDLFNKYPVELGTGEVDILSFDDHLLMMIRDVGHALSVDSTIENDNIRVSYFVPKSCNIEKVNKLKGVTKLDPLTSDMFSPTNGEFVCKKEDFTSEMIDFISNVPTDIDAFSKSNFMH
ncbi:unknown [Clostridium sp. CAG:433]|nr:unknown [Clostridium sp. CAG:433]